MKILTNLALLLFIISFINYENSFAQEVDPYVENANKLKKTERKLNDKIKLLNKQLLQLENVLKETKNLSKNNQIEAENNIKILRNEISRISNILEIVKLAIAALEKKVDNSLEQAKVAIQVSNDALDTATRALDKVNALIDKLNQPKWGWYAGIGYPILIGGLSDPGQASIFPKDNWFPVGFSLLTDVYYRPIDSDFWAGLSLSYLFYKVDDNLSGSYFPDFTYYVHSMDLMAIGVYRANWLPLPAQLYLGVGYQLYYINIHKDNSPYNQTFHGNVILMGGIRFGFWQENIWPFIEYRYLLADDSQFYQASSVLFGVKYSFHENKFREVKAKKKQ